MIKTKIITLPDDVWEEFKDRCNSMDVCPDDGILAAIRLWFEVTDEAIKENGSTIPKHQLH